MNNRMFIYAAAAGFALVFSLGAEPPPAPGTNAPKSLESYAIGVDLARNFKRQGIDVDMESVIRGMRDGGEGKKIGLYDVCCG